jgi:hypothetical protein
MQPSDCGEITLCKIRYFVRGSRWGRTIDQKMVTVQGASTPLTLIQIRGSQCYK